jgi:hypothetical protein
MTPVPPGGGQQVTVRLAVAVGDRVELTDASQYSEFGLSDGDTGRVLFTDSLGTVHIRWDDGRQIGIVARDADMISVIPRSVSS